jgi:hypothetical protein
MATGDHMFSEGDRVTSEEFPNSIGTVIDVITTPVRPGGSVGYKIDFIEKLTALSGKRTVFYRFDEESLLHKVVKP